MMVVTSKAFIFVILCSLINVAGLSQDHEVTILETLVLTDFPKVKSNNAPLDPADTCAVFSQAMVNFYIMAGNAIYQHLSGLPGRLTVTFTIDETGKMMNIKSSNPEASEVIKSKFSSLPDWVPARRKGKKVSSHFLMDVICSEPSEFLTYLRDSLYIPAQAVMNGSQGTIVLRLEADSKGAFIDVKLAKVRGLPSDPSVDYGPTTLKVLSRTPANIIKGLVATTGMARFRLYIYYELRPFIEGLAITENPPRIRDNIYELRTVTIRPVKK